jgi:hypothetical protein
MTTLYESRSLRSKLVLTLVLLTTVSAMYAQTTLNVGSGQTYTTIQAAINAASTTQVDTINIVTSPITESGILVNKNVYMRGLGAGNAVIQAAVSPGIASNRVLSVSAGYVVTMKNLTIQNGRAPAGANNSTPSANGGDGSNGGGILNQGTLTMINCKVLNNYAGNGGQGGPGLYPPGGPVVPTGHGGNGGMGGGVYNENTLFVYRTTFTGNRGGSGGAGGVPGAGYVGGTIPGDLNGGPGTDGGNGGSGGHGSAIYNMGSLKVIECTFDANLAGNGSVGRTGSDGGDGITSGKAAIKCGSGGYGGIGGIGGNGGRGAIYNANVIDTLINSTFYANIAGSGGNGGNGGNGGIGILGVDSIQNPVLGPVFYGGEGGDGGSGGNGGNGGSAGSGGAIYCVSATAMNYCCNVSFTMNIAGNAAGNGGNGGNCGMWGFSGNASPSPPGIPGQPGQVGTNGSGGNGGAGGMGGAFYGSAGTFIFKNSILAGNSYTPTVANAGAPGSQIMGNSGIYGLMGANGAGHDVYGNVITAGFNLVGKKDNSNFVNGVNNDICGTIPSPVVAQFGILSDNGGPTKTVNIAINSPGRDNADPANAPLFDQRGMSRNGILDRGAYEYYTPILSVSYDGNITEGAENGEVITLTVTDDVFNATINASGFTLSNLPVGVTRGTVNRTGDHTATVLLSGNRTTDYDADILNVSLDISHTELAGLTSGTMHKDSIAEFLAYDESSAASLDTVLHEYYMNGDTIHVTLSEDWFVDAILSAGNFTLSNAPAGTSISQAIWVDGTHADLVLGFSGTDFDVDSNHVTVTIHDAEVFGVASLITNEFVIVAGLETALNDNGLASQMEIFPNPMGDLLMVDANGIQIMSLSIHSITGEKLYEMNGGQWTNGPLRIETSNLRPGIYLLQITTEVGAVNKVLVKIGS